MSFLDFAGVTDFSKTPISQTHSLPSPERFIAMHDTYRSHPNVKLIEKEVGRIVEDQVHLLNQVLEDPAKKEAAFQAWLEMHQLDSASEDDPEQNAFSTEILERIERGEVCPGGGICGCTVFGQCVRSRRQG